MMYNDSMTTTVPSTRIASLIATGVTDVLAIVSNVPGSGVFTHDFSVILPVVAGVMTVLHFHVPAMVAGIVAKLSAPTVVTTKTVAAPANPEVQAALNDAIAALGKITGAN